MQSIRHLKTLADDELLRRLAALLAASRHSEADLLAHIGEVDARRLYVRQAASSMFVYCTERLHLSEAEACLRIAAARAAREHPVILEMLADGRLHLSAIARLAPHLTAENRDDLLRRATHRTKREVDELVAELSPRPDVPAAIRKLPDRIRKLPAGRVVARPISDRLGISEAPGEAKAKVRPEWVDSDRLAVVGGCGEVASAPPSDPSSAAGPEQPQPSARDRDCVSGVEGRSTADASSDLAAFGTRLPWVASRPRPAVIEPLAPSRYKVQFTASAQLREKLERLRTLMLSSVPEVDLAAVIEVAVTEKLERLEARRFGRASSPRKSVSTSDITARTRRIPAAVKRAVDERDEGRCRYVDGHGHRCTSRARLEFHHRRPWAIGGDHSPDNISLQCAAHNRLVAEVDFGRDVVDRHVLSSARAPGSRLRSNTG